MVNYLLILIFTAQSDCREAFLNKVLESENYRHYFIAVKVKTEKTLKEIVVLNYDLRKSLISHDSAFQDMNFYKSFIKEKINHDQPIDLTQADLDTMNATPVIKNRDVEKQATKGKKYFLYHFFDVSEKYNYASLKLSVKGIQVTAIVRQLFQWNYLTGLVESNISILEKNFCDDQSGSGKNTKIDN
jgi:hypothetical protein